MAKIETARYSVLLVLAITDMSAVEPVAASDIIHYRYDALERILSTERRAIGGQLRAGETLLSSDGRFRLSLQFDGDVALYGAHGELLWHLGTGGSGGNWLVLQNDGNLVLYILRSNQFGIRPPLASSTLT